MRVREIERHRSEIFLDAFVVGQKWYREEFGSGQIERFRRRSRQGSCTGIEEKHRERREIR